MTSAINRRQALAGAALTGSLIAAGKLQGVVASRPVVFPGVRLLAAGLTAVAIYALV